MSIAQIFNTNKMAQNAAAYSTLFPDNLPGQIADLENRKEIAKITADARIKAIEQNAKSDQDLINSRANQEIDLIKSRRFAGNVAALGGLAYAGGRLLFEDDLKPPKPIKRESADFSSVIEAQKELIEKSQDNIEALKKLKGDLKVDDIELSPIVSSDSSGTNSSKPSTVSTPSSPVELKVGGAGWSPLGSTIQFAEGTYQQGDKKYNTGFGYNMFEGNTYPDRVFGGVSAAAGAYQFMPDTWKGAKAALNLPDFGPESQEKAGEYLAQKRGVQTSKPFTTVSELRDAVDLLAPEWASFPRKSTGRSYYDGDGINNAKSFDSIRKFYEKQVGYQLQ